MLCETKPVQVVQTAESINSCVWSPRSATVPQDSGSGDPTLVVTISLTVGIAAVLVAGIVVAVACVMVQRAKIKYELVLEDKAPRHQVVPEVQEQEVQETE